MSSKNFNLQCTLLSLANLGVIHKLRGQEVGHLWPCIYPLWTGVDISFTMYILDVLSYSIASGIPVTLTRVKCWNINHQNHKHTYSHEVHDQNDRSNRCNTLYGCDDWYFSIWHVSMSQEFHWQLSNWVGPLLWFKIRKRAE